MTEFHDALEWRPLEAREHAQWAALPVLVSHAQASTAAFAEMLHAAALANRSAAFQR